MMSIEVNGISFVKKDGLLGKVSRTVARGIARMPSAVIDGGQQATHKVARAAGYIVEPVPQLKRMVDATGGFVSNMLGSTSRLLGKPKHMPQEVMFLYDRQLDHLGTSKIYQNAIRVMLGLALTNVVLYWDEMMGEPGDLNDLPILRDVVTNLQRAGANEEDIGYIVKLLGCNGKRDIDISMVPKILGTLKDTQGKYKESGPIDEIRWIANHPNGYRRLPPNETTDYKLNTKYMRCTTLFPPILSDEPITNIK